MKNFIAAQPTNEGRRLISVASIAEINETADPNLTELLLLSGERLLLVRPYDAIKLELALKETRAC